MDYLVISKIVKICSYKKYEVTIVLIRVVTNRNRNYGRVSRLALMGIDLKQLRPFPLPVYHLAPVAELLLLDVERTDTI